MEDITKSIIITGASAGIGRALAEEFAAQGVVIGLIGRNASRLQVVAEICSARGAVVEIAQLDVTDGEKLSVWVEKFDSRYPIDLMIANAGVTAASGGSELLEDRAAAQALIDINLTGVVNAVYAAIPRMQQRGRGQIALVSSLAAWRGMAQTPLYSGTKAAVKAYGEALRDLMAPAGIRVSVILPGFVETDMSDRFPGLRPRMISAREAAKKIRRGLDRNPAYIAFPWSFAQGMKLLSVLPFGIGSFLFRLLSFQSTWR